MGRFCPGRGRRSPSNSSSTVYAVSAWCSTARTWTPPSSACFLVRPLPDVFRQRKTYLTLTDVASATAPESSPLAMTAAARMSVPVDIPATNVRGCHLQTAPRRRGTGHLAVGDDLAPALRRCSQRTSTVSWTSTNPPLSVDRFGLASSRLWYPPGPLPVYNKTAFSRQLLQPCGDTPPYARVAGALVSGQMAKALRREKDGPSGSPVHAERRGVPWKTCCEDRCSRRSP